MNFPTSKSESPTVTLLRWLVPLLVFFLVIRTPNDNDMWWHLRAGQDMLAQHQVITWDQFSFTRAGEPWVNAFWLADIVIYLVYRMGGFFALSLFSASLIALTMALVMKHSSGPIPLRTILVLIASFGISPLSAVRPQLFSFLFLAFLDLELERTRQTQRIKPLVLIPLFIIWANVHGGYFFGLLLLGAVITGEILNRLFDSDGALPWKFIGKLALWGAVAGISTALNPNGLAIWRLPFYTVQVSVSSIAEWASPDFHRLDLQPVLWLIFLLILGLGFSQKKLTWPNALKFIGFAYMSFVSQRGIAPFLVIAVPVVSLALTSAWEEYLYPRFAARKTDNYQRQSPGINTRIARLINAAIIVGVALAALGRAYSLSTPQMVFSGYPENAVNWIKINQPEGPMFNSYNWGGYLTWSLPEYPVFIDGRADLYGDALLGGWWDVVNGSDKGLALLDQWKIKFVLLEPGWEILHKLPAMGWRLLYQDDLAIIYGR